MRRKRNNVISINKKEIEDKDDKNFKYLSLKHLFKNNTNTTTDFSTIDSNTFNTITNTYNTISNTFHTLSNERNSFKTEVKIPYQTKVKFTKDSNLQTEEELIKHRRMIKSPTQRKKQHSSTGIFTQKQLNKQKKTIESESKKPKRNKDYLRIKSKQEYLEEEENKKKEIKNQIKKKLY